jgi:hypothetical protein
MEKSKRKEIKRIRHILDEIVSLAEDDELRGGLLNAVKRYNAIVRHLETKELLPAGLFQVVSEEEDAVSFHQIGVESRMLSGYLEEIIDEEEEEDSQSKPDFGPVIALAPFLEHGDLKALIHSHLSGKGFSNAGSARPSPDPQAPPSLEDLVGLAPHVSKKDLAEMVDACLAREPVVDPNMLVALAPHMDRQELGRLMRQYAPAWFSGRRADSEAPAPPKPPTSPTPPASPWQDSPVTEEAF